MFAGAAAAAAASAAAAAVASATASTTTTTSTTATTTTTTATTTADTSTIQCLLALAVAAAAALALALALLLLLLLPLLLLLLLLLLLPLHDQTTILPEHFQFGAACDTGTVCSMSITVEVRLLSGKTATVQAGLEEKVEALKLRSQTALGIGKGRLVDPSGSVLDAAAQINSTGLQDGDSLTLHLSSLVAEWIHFAVLPTQKLKVYTFGGL